MIKVTRNPHYDRRQRVHLIAVAYAKLIPLLVIASWCLTHWK